MSVELPSKAKLQRLFSNCDCYTQGDPLEFGFYELNLPDAFRWVGRTATCLLKQPVITPQSRWVLLITANSGSHLWCTYLSVEINGIPIGEKQIPTYGHYYFNVESSMINKTDVVSVAIKVNGKTIEENGKHLAMTIYGIGLIDVEQEDANFDERNLFIDQVKIFRPSTTRLSGILTEKKMSRESVILDIGAGVGWTTILLAAYTGAHAIAIDPNHYRDSQEHRSESKERFSRHLSALRKEPGFEAIKTQSDIDKAVEHCRFLTMSAMKMDFNDETFDLVFSLNAFEHIPDPAVALREIQRVLKPGGEAYLQFQPLYYSDGGSHLPACGLLNRPWAHLLYERNEIKRMVIEEGKVPNEIDNILDSLNCWSANQYHDLFANSGLSIVNKYVNKGFTIPGADKSEEFTLLKKRYPEEELTTVGIVIHMRKDIERGFMGQLKRACFKLNSTISA